MVVMVAVPLLMVVMVAVPLLQQCVASVLWEQPGARTRTIHPQCAYHWSRDTARWVARAMLHAVLEETERAFIRRQGRAVHLHGHPH
jgi:hypothetical protein